MSVSLQVVEQFVRIRYSDSLKAALTHSKSFRLQLHLARRPTDLSILIEMHMARINCPGSCARAHSNVYTHFVCTHTNRYICQSTSPHRMHYNTTVYTRIDGVCCVVRVAWLIIGMPPSADDNVETWRWSSANAAVSDDDRRHRDVLYIFYSPVDECTTATHRGLECTEVVVCSMCTEPRHQRL